MRLSEEEWKQLQERRQGWKAKASAETCAKKGKARRNDAEHQEQKALIEWCTALGYPYTLLFAIPNGGGRSKAEAGKFKAEGVKSGVPDLFLPVARGSSHGLFIEMKARGGRLDVKQKVWQSELLEQGYCVETCWGWEEARQVIDTYLKQ